VKLKVSAVLLSVGQRNSAEQPKHSGEQDPTHDIILDAYRQRKLRKEAAGLQPPAFQRSQRCLRRMMPPSLMIELEAGSWRLAAQIRIGMMM
jgi:hypothetical protein